MIVLDHQTQQRLMALPIDRTLTLKIDDRNFTILDTEFFYDICRLARLVVEPFK